VSGDERVLVNRDYSLSLLYVAFLLQDLEVREKTDTKERQGNTKDNNIREHKKKQGESNLKTTRLNNLTR
jgi:type III secretory pathway component EscU